MNGRPYSIMDYLQGITKRFSIPVYQRNYDWGKENCRQLFDDLLKVIDDERASHFFGSIVSILIKPPKQEPVNLIIDGQQRLTTVTLLLLAIHNLLKAKVIESERALADLIWKFYLTVDYDLPTSEPHLKLEMIKNDQTAFRMLFSGNEDTYINSSNITENYKNFCKWIREKISLKPQEGKITVDQLFSAIKSLEIISIELDENEDDPQLIFESLNSTGLNLTEGDKVRNFILMDLPVEVQKEYYDKYWNPIENYTKAAVHKYDVTPFIRDYLSLRKGKIVDQKYIYPILKEFVTKNYDTSNNKMNKEPFLQILLEYAAQYGLLLNGETQQFEVPDKLKECILRLNWLETSVTRPFFLEVLMLHKKGELKMDDVTEIFLITESYLFRRTACDLPTSVINSIFVTLHNEIMRYDGTSNNYVEKFKYALLSKKDRGLFPFDLDFKKGFTERFAYRNKTAIYILERLENFKTDETTDVYEFCKKGKCSIEHIMPQTLNAEWRADLKMAGDDPNQVHDTWLHRIANLTLVAKEYNSKYSNHRFLYKRDMPNGFKVSGFRLNSTYIGKLDKWTSKEMEERAEVLSKNALEIWPRPKTDFVPPKPVLDSYTLSQLLEDDSLVSRDIYSFKFSNEQEQEVSKGWKEMFQQMIEFLYKENNSILLQLAESQEKGIASRFYAKKEDNKKLYGIDTGLYVNIPGGNVEKINVLQKLFERYEIPTTDLVFYFKPIDKAACMKEE